MLRIGACTLRCTAAGLEEWRNFSLASWGWSREREKCKGGGGDDTSGSMDTLP